MTDLLGPDINGNGEKVSAATLRSAAKRVLLSHMRLGFYDNHAADYPFANASIDWSLLDSASHRSAIFV